MLLSRCFKIWSIPHFIAFAVPRLQVRAQVDLAIATSRQPPGKFRDSDYPDYAVRPQIVRHSRFKYLLMGAASSCSCEYSELLGGLEGFNFCWQRIIPFPVFPGRKCDLPQSCKEERFETAILIQDKGPVSS
jgi:hypothetical protein